MPPFVLQSALLVKNMGKTTTIAPRIRIRWRDRDRGCPAWDGIGNKMTRKKGRQAKTWRHWQVKKKNCNNTTSNSNNGKERQRRKIQNIESDGKISKQFAPWWYLLSNNGIFFVHFVVCWSHSNLNFLTWCMAVACLACLLVCTVCSAMIFFLALPHRI